MGITAALDRIDGIEGGGRVRCVFVVAESERDAPAFRARLVEKMALLKLPGDEGDPI